MGADVYFPYIPAGESRRGAYTALLADRGVYDFQPLKISSRFPLGLLRTMQRLDKPQRVLVANVGGEAIARLVSEGVQAKWSLVPEFIAPVMEAVGVRCGYTLPAKLGVDRWLGVIAAFHRLRGDACVVNVGTAMTIDGVDAHGQHLGGVIVPGPDLAVASLLHNTSDIATHAQSGEVRDALFADNTLGAIHQGTAHMLAALIEKSVITMRERVGKTPSLILSGGASHRVAPLVTTDFETVPDLVLQGLAVLARG